MIIVGSAGMLLDWGTFMDDCWKDKFDNEEKAREAAQARGPRLGCYFHVYKCDRCDDWHISKHTRKTSIRMQKKKRKRKRF